MEPQALVIFLHRRSDTTFRPYGSVATSAKCVSLGSANHGRVYRIQRGATYVGEHRAGFGVGA